MTTRPADIRGEVFGRLKAIRRIGKDKRGAYQWLCQCSCGGQTVALVSNLRNGNKRSCGCLKTDSVLSRCTSHGQAGRENKRTPTYRSWSAMRDRCTQPNHSGWEYYGGRGIRVCERWDSFENFLEDMGERPDGMTLDRVDVNGDYEPGNCRWATPTQQGKNRRKLRYSARKECLFCGTEFRLQRSNQKYCSPECRGKMEQRREAVC